MSGLNDVHPAAGCRYRYSKSNYINNTIKLLHSSLGHCTQNSITVFTPDQANCTKEDIEEECDSITLNKGPVRAPKES